MFRWRPAAPVDLTAPAWHCGNRHFRSFVRTAPDKPVNRLRRFSTRRHFIRPYTSRPSSVYPCRTLVEDHAAPFLPYARPQARLLDSRAHEAPGGFRAYLSETWLLPFPLLLH